MATGMGMGMGRAARGFTLVDVVITCVLVAVLAGVALPSYRAQLTKSRRVDAIAALTRLQAAQERWRSVQGLYSSDFNTLRVTPRSDEGLYALAIELSGPDGYRATATALAGESQAGDRDCLQLAVDVKSGFAQIGPNARCWNR